LNGNGCLEPLTQIGEVGKKLRDDHRLIVDFDAREHRRASRWQRLEQRVDATTLRLARAGESMHHHEPSRRDHVREVALY
jgi:hypothetical protein